MTQFAKLALKNLEKAEAVRQGLEKMGLGHFPINFFPEDRKGEVSISVTLDEGIGLDVKSEVMNKYFDVDLFLYWFEGRKNFLKLSVEERRAITIHPQMWEANFLAERS
jgi:hypothetical protein